MSRLSVIVPCYNVESLVSETICSLARAGGPGIELLLIDDGSTDATGELLEQLAPSLPGSRVLHNHENLGLSATRNVGLDAATGRYLAFLDGDDFVASGYYEQLIGEIEQLGCELVRTDHVQVRGRRRSVHRIPYGPRGVVASPRSAILPATRVTSVDSPHCWSGIYSRALAERGLLHFDESLRTCEDRPWIWRLHLRARSFAVVGLTGHFYRRDVSQSLTRTSHPRQLDFLRAFDQIVADVLTDPDAEVLLPKALRSYAAMMCHHLARIEPASQPPDHPASQPPAEAAGNAGFSYDGELTVTLRAGCRDALRRLPQSELAAVLGGLDGQRRDVLVSLLREGR